MRPPRMAVQLNGAVRPTASHLSPALPPLNVPNLWCVFRTSIFNSDPPTEKFVFLRSERKRFSLGLPAKGGCCGSKPRHVASTRKTNVPGQPRTVGVSQSFGKHLFRITTPWNFSLSWWLRGSGNCRAKKFLFQAFGTAVALFPT